MSLSIEVDYQMSVDDCKLGRMQMIGCISSIYQSTGSFWYTLSVFWVVRWVASRQLRATRLFLYVNYLLVMCVSAEADQSELR